MPKTLPIPGAAIRDPDSVEMFRAWIAEHGLHCSIKVGMYEEQGMDEARAWGILLSDVIRHVGDAMHQKHGKNPAQVAADIKRSLLTELGEPTSDTSGSFAG